jgi:hypothetical protein
MTTRINRTNSGRSNRLRLAGGLVVDSKKRRRYSLDELLAQCKPAVRRSRAECDWVTGPPAGRELA